MRPRNPISIAAILILAACSRDYDYYKAHPDDAEAKLNQCSAADLETDKECDAAFRAMRSINAGRDLDDMARQREYDRRIERHRGKCDLTAIEDRDACIARVAGGADPDAIVLELTGMAARCERDPGRKSYLVPVDSWPVIDCAQTFVLALPKGWQWRNDTADQTIDMWPSPNAAKNSSPSRNSAETVDCMAGSIPAAKSSQAEINAEIVRYAKSQREEAAKQSPRAAAFYTATLYDVGPATGLLQRSFRDFESNRYVVVRADFAIPGRSFEIRCTLRTSTEGERFEGRPLIATMEQIVKSLVPLNMPVYR